MPAPTHIVIPDGNQEAVVFLDENDDLTALVTALMETGTDLDKIAVYELRRKTLRIAKVELGDE